jgi:hypothetical protein
MASGPSPTGEREIYIEVDGRFSGYIIRALSETPFVVPLRPLTG